MSVSVGSHADERTARTVGEEEEKEEEEEECQRGSLSEQRRPICVY